MKIAICDDDKNLAGELEEIILYYEKQKNKIYEIDVFYSGLEITRELDKGNTYDLIFLDIEMEEINGLEVGEKIRNEMDDYGTQIIYISSKEGYDRQLFDFQPLHFISKPINKEIVYKDLELAEKVSRRNSEVFTYIKNSELYRINIKDIVYFESRGREIRVVCTKGEDYYYDNMKNLLRKIEDYRFLHIHRSYIVNYDHIIKMKSNEIMMSNNDILPISRSKQDEVKKRQIELERVDRI